MKTSKSCTRLAILTCGKQAYDFVCTDQILSIEIPKARVNSDEIRTAAHLTFESVVPMVSKEWNLLQA